MVLLLLCVLRNLVLWVGVAICFLVAIDLFPDCADSLGCALVCCPVVVLFCVLSVCLVCV